MIYVVDASVAIKWYAPEIYEQEATKLLHGNHAFHAPELIYPEFSNILWKKVRRGEIIAAEGQRIITRFAQKNLASWRVARPNVRQGLTTQTRKQPQQPQIIEECA
jgi:predicted nucleic acid-binding protein